MAVQYSVYEYKDYFLYKLYNHIKKCRQKKDLQEIARILSREKNYTLSLCAQMHTASISSQMGLLKSCCMGVTYTVHILMSQSERGKYQYVQRAYKDAMSNFEAKSFWTALEDYHKLTS